MYHWLSIPSYRLFFILEHFDIVTAVFRVTSFAGLLFPSFSSPYSHLVYVLPPYPHPVRTEMTTQPTRQGLRL